MKTLPAEKCVICDDTYIPKQKRVNPSGCCSPKCNMRRHRLLKGGEPLPFVRNDPRLANELARPRGKPKAKPKTKTGAKRSNLGRYATVAAKLRTAANNAGVESAVEPYLLALEVVCEDADNEDPVSASMVSQVRQFVDNVAKWIGQAEERKLREASLTLASQVEFVRGDLVKPPWVEAYERSLEF